MKFDIEQDLDIEIKRTKLEVLKLTGGILSGIMITMVIAAAAGLGWSIWQILG